MDLIHLQRLWFKLRLLYWHQHHTGKMVEPSHCKSKYHNYKHSPDGLTYPPNQCMAI